jgi:hypothetical protein
MHAPCNEWCARQRIRAHNAAHDLDEYFHSNDRKLYELQLIKGQLQDVHEVVVHAS